MSGKPIGFPHDSIESATTERGSSPASSKLYAA
jgi:hypothetical protein